MDNDSRIRQIAQEEIAKSSNTAQFGVVPIPAHAHTGVDSAQVDGSNLVGPVLARVVSYSGTGTTFTPPGVGIDLYDVTNLSATGTFNPPNGQPFNGSLLRIRITSSNTATARAFTFSTATGGYIANSPAFPTATTTGKTTNLGFEYDMSNSVNRWRLIWSANS